MPKALLSVIATAAEYNNDCENDNPCAVVIVKKMA